MIWLKFKNGTFKKKLQCDNNLGHLQCGFTRNWVPILYEDPIDSKVTRVNVDFKQFGEVWKFQYRGGSKFFFQFFKCCLLLLFPFERQLLFEVIQKYCCHLQRSFDELLIKLAKLKKDHMPLTMIGIFQSLMACNFLGSNLTSSLDNMCPRKFISLEFLSKFTFHLVSKKIVLTELTQNILKVFYMIFYYFGVHQDISNVDDHKLV